MSKKTKTILVVLVVLLVPLGIFFGPALWAKFKNNDLDFTDKDISGKDLSKRNLKGIILKGAKIDGVNFEGSTGISLDINVALKDTKPSIRVKWLNGSIYQYNTQFKMYVYNPTSSASNGKVMTTGEQTTQEQTTWTPVPDIFTRDYFA